MTIGVVQGSPVPAGLSTAGLSTAGLSTAGLSTTGRLARQSGVAPATGRVTPAADNSGTGPAAATILPAVVLPAAAAPRAAAPVTSAPQDFAALVDRLVEARATAHGTAAPLPISTTVSHAEFGKVSLTFRHDPAGLAVSMTSADPGFAPAAQTAASVLPTGPGHDATGEGSSRPSGTPAWAQPAVTGQGASPSAAGGGGSQAQSQAQSQGQPLLRPGFIAANRAAGASGDSPSDSARPPRSSTGIFA